MIRHGLKAVSILLVSLLLFACSGETEFQINMKVSLDGRPLGAAIVKVDGTEFGRTGPDGTISKALRRRPGTEVRLAVEKELDGQRIKPWQGSFVVKVPGGEPKTEYAFDVELKGTKYLTVSVSDKSGPVEGAAIELGGKLVGESNSDGKYTYESEKLRKDGIRIEVTKKGYAPWKKTLKVAPGETVEANLSRQTVLVVKALTEEYGVTKPLAGVGVSVDGHDVGATGKNGSLSYKYGGTPGSKVSVKLTASNRIPKAWKKTVVMDGDTEVEHFFYSAAPAQIRVGIYGYAANTPGETLEAERARMSEALANRLFSYLSFKEVPHETFLKEVKDSKLAIDALVAKGWNRSALGNTVDMIILGSVSKDDSGLAFETKVYASGGKLLLSRINYARRMSDIKGVAKKVADSIIEEFPFEGTVVAVEDDRYQINLGKNDYGMSRGMEFDILDPSTDGAGKARGYKNIGVLRLTRAAGDSSWGSAEGVKKGRTVNPGDRVVRRVVSEEAAAGAKTSFTLVAKGGVATDTAPLQSVNVYLNDEWVGSTDPSGKLEIPARLGKKHRLLLYRHGYDKLADVVYLNKDAETREFALNVNNAVLKIDSDPSGAEVFIDGVSAGTTPLLEGRPVPFGFHTLRLKTGGDYREWEEVVEFNTKTVDLTGSNKVRFYKDYLKLGARAEAAGDIGGAVELYKSAERQHPDYSNIKNRLGQLYMDSQHDYASAIREFEEVLSIPENRDIVYKQFSVTYANLGHAYYEAGNALITTDRSTAATDLAKAVQNLEKAKQNTRFFPSDHYEEAVHDTYYFTAIAYHKLYLVTKKAALLEKADIAWREYFDFFPKKLEADQNFASIREGARKYWSQVHDMM